MSNAIDSILEERRKREEEAKGNAERFFSVLRAEGLNENFLELRFQNGIVTLFKCSDIKWASYDPENRCIDIDFEGFLVTITGRGLFPDLLHGIKSNRVAWISEANSEMQDNPELPCFISDIRVAPPSWMESSES